jgi:hypothetical protein
VSGEEHTVDMRRDAVGKLGGRADGGGIVQSGEGREAEAGAGAGRCAAAARRGSVRSGEVDGDAMSSTSSELRRCKDPFIEYGDRSRVVHNLNPLIGSELGGGGVTKKSSGASHSLTESEW